MKFDGIARFVPNARDSERFCGSEIFLRGFPGENNYRELFKFFLAAQPFEKLQARFVTEPQIGDENIGKGKARAVCIHSSADEISACFAGVTADEGMASCVREGAPNEQRVVRVVFQNEKGRPKFLFHCANRLARAVSWEMRKAPE